MMTATRGCVDEIELLDDSMISSILIQSRIQALGAETKFIEVVSALFILDSEF